MQEYVNDGVAKLVARGPPTANQLVLSSRRNILSFPKAFVKDCFLFKRGNIDEKNLMKNSY
jgi:hypothetical protein